MLNVAMYKDEEVYATKKTADRYAGMRFKCKFCGCALCLKQSSAGQYFFARIPGMEHTEAYCQRLSSQKTAFSFRGEKPVDVFTEIINREWKAPIPPKRGNPPLIEKPIIEFPGPESGMTDIDGIDGASGEQRPGDPGGGRDDGGADSFFVTGPDGGNDGGVETPTVEPPIDGGEATDGEDPGIDPGDEEEPWIVPEDELEDEPEEEPEYVGPPRTARDMLETGMIYSIASGNTQVGPIKHLKDCFLCYSWAEEVYPKQWNKMPKTGAVYCKCSSYRNNSKGGLTINAFAFWDKEGKKLFVNFTVNVNGPQLIKAILKTLPRMVESEKYPKGHCVDNAMIIIGKWKPETLKENAFYMTLKNPGQIAAIELEGNKNGNEH